MIAIKVMLKVCLVTTSVDFFIVNTHTIIILSLQYRSNFDTFIVTIIGILNEFTETLL